MTYHNGRTEWTQRNLGFPFSVDPQAIMHNERIIETASIKSLCFISNSSVYFIHSAIKVFKYQFVFIYLIFIFHIILQSFKKMPPIQLFPGALHWRIINTANPIIGGSEVTLKDTNLLLD